jgi:alpha/beta hydrolase fold
MLRSRARGSLLIFRPSPRHRSHTSPRQTSFRVRCYAGITRLILETSTPNEAHAAPMLGDLGASATVTGPALLLGRARKVCPYGTDVPGGPKSMAIFGSSAGGNLTLAMVLRAKQDNLPLPGAIQTNAILPRRERARDEGSVRGDRPVLRQASREMTPCTRLVSPRKARRDAMLVSWLLVGANRLRSTG